MYVGVGGGEREREERGGDWVHVWSSSNELIHRNAEIASYRHSVLSDAVDCGSSFLHPIAATWIRTHALY